MPPEYWTDYMWLVVVGAMLSFAMAYGIGANDVANAFGTSVGAKTLTLAQACMIAAVFEFAGAVGLGGEVAKTIAGSIARPASFQANPEIFAYGMMVALAAAMTVVIVATYLSLAVSTTHSIIGAVLGFAFVWGGSGAVVWNDSMDEFPYSKGLVPVICSWFVSPISSGIVASVLFGGNRFLILRRQNSTNFAIYSFPILVAVTVFINIFFVLYKGAKNVLHWESNKAAWVAGCVAGGCFVLGLFPGIWVVRWSVTRDMAKHAEKAAAIEDAKGKADEEVAAEAEPTSKAMKVFNSMKKAAMHGIRKDIHEDVEHSQAIHDMHAAAEVFNPETEQVYKYLQVFSACAVSFAHGANDVANAVGPLCGIWSVYKTWTVVSTADLPIWILILGASGIVVGLATYGYNIMAVLGVGLAKMTPSRGFAAELATSFTVSIASVYGLPVSTTQCITGAEAGVGLTENIRTGMNWKLLLRQIAAWVVAFISSCLLSACFFAMGGYAPSITMAKDITVYENTIRSISSSLYSSLNKTNFALTTNFSDSPFDATLNTTIYAGLKNYTNMFNTKVIGYIEPSQLLQQLNSSIYSYLNYSVPVTGFNRSTAIKTNTGGPLANSQTIVNPYPIASLKNK